MQTLWAVIYITTSLLTGAPEIRTLAVGLVSREECEMVAKQVNDADWSDRAKCVRMGE
jgi:hypothetical protein